MLNMTVINPNCDSDNLNNQMIYINSGDDFKLNFKLLAKSQPLDLFNLNLQLDFYVNGREEVYTASIINGECTNCLVDFNSGIIKCIFNNHNLKPGYLFVNIKVSYFDPDYPDGIGGFSSKKNMNIIIKNI